MVGRQSTVNGAGVSCRAEFETLVTGTDPAVLRVPRANLPPIILLKTSWVIQGSMRGGDCSIAHLRW